MGLQLRKKAQTDFISLFFVLAVLFGIAIFALILYNAYNDNIKDNLNDALTHSTPVDSGANVTKILNQTSGGINMLNPLFPLLLIGLFGFGLGMALMGKSHPAFFFVGIIILAVSIILAVVFSNVYEGIATNTNFENSSDDFDVMSLIMSHLPTAIFLLFIAISIVLYAFKGQGAPAGGPY